VALLLPSCAHAGSGRPPRCMSNLRQIGLANLIWANDHAGKFPMQVSVTNGGAMELASTGDVAGMFRTMTNYLYSPKALWCPSDKDRVATTNFSTGISAKNISYFVGLDAATNHPQVFLAGDDNFAIDKIVIRPGLLTVSTNAPTVWKASPTSSWGARMLRFPTNALVVWTDARHANRGNVVMVDGSVTMTTSSNLQQMLMQTGVATNRLAIP
jgi:prepilin-type processing-associated H-X9-DG protein